MYLCRNLNQKIILKLKKMKKIVLSIVVIAGLLTACKENKKEKVEVKEAVEVVVNVADLNNLDISSSVLNWKGTKPTGAHNGTVQLNNGGLTLKDGIPGEGVFIIDMNTIACEDLKGTEGAGKLEGHLKSADFFDVEKFSTAKFVITNVEKVDSLLNVTGNLTLKEITKSITIPASINTENGITTFKSDSFTIDRTDFGVTYKSKKLDAALKDKFIDDLMELSFEVKTKS